MSSYCAISPTSSAPWLRRRATTSSMSSTANMMRRMPSVFAGALSGSALTAGGVWNFVSSTRLWPSGVDNDHNVVHPLNRHIPGA
jgi:hypothetical protein